MREKKASKMPATKALGAKGWVHPLSSGGGRRSQGEVEGLVGTCGV